jgi:hypothetical protein
MEEPHLAPPVTAGLWEMGFIIDRAESMLLLIYVADWRVYYLEVKWIAIDG